MKARDLVQRVPTVHGSDPVTKAVALMSEQKLPGLIVVDDKGRPRHVLPGTQVLRMAVLHAYQGDTALARTIDEEHADNFWTELGERTVTDCVAAPGQKAVTVTEDATLLEMATLMAKVHSPVLPVVDGSGVLVGVVTLTKLLSTLALKPDAQV
ncbi:CBS domain-containing protein [Propionibacteriaceae bacterium Y1685]|uniref:CBS domain-containing protein n=1 Tax=Microlunatus sp. Y1700 TaxID=3418487 RepID=UPI003B818746